MSQASLIPTASQSPIFSFKSHEIRTVMVDGQPWFVARDVCAALGICWNGTALKSVPNAWKGLRSFRTPSGNQPLKVISEPAVYKLAFRSNKAEADEFTNWVASEVLPAIRKTGKFEAATVKATGPRKRREVPMTRIEAELMHCAHELNELGKLAYEFRHVMDRAHRLAGPLFQATYSALGWNSRLGYGTDALAEGLGGSYYRSVDSMQGAFEEARIFLSRFRTLARLHGM